ncbi:MAG: hypothetical protein NVS9B1_00900 [Candidatus Dormibacteraceae bacterium]
MNIDVGLIAVRKGRGAVHLTVRAAPDDPTETLCERRLAAGDYSVTDEEPSCQACLRRRDNPAALTSALFEQDLGSKLLELSLVRSTRPPRAEEETPVSNDPPPRLRVVSSHAPEMRPDAPASKPTPPPHRPSGLDLTTFESLGDDLYRSPVGARVRLERKEDGGWRVAGIEFDGKITIDHLADGRVRLQVGDIRVQYAGEIEPQVRLL